MFDIGWTEMLVIAVVMIVVVGPKDLPRMLRTFGRTTAKLRSMAGDFQKQFNEALREAELEDVKKSVDELKNLNPASQIKKQLNPFEKAAQDIRAGLDTLEAGAAQQRCGGGDHRCRACGRAAEERGDRAARRRRAARHANRAAGVPGHGRCGRSGGGGAGRRRSRRGRTCKDRRR